MSGDHNSLAMPTSRIAPSRAPVEALSASRAPRPGRSARSLTVARESGRVARGATAGSMGRRSPRRCRAMRVLRVTSGALVLTLAPVVGAAEEAPAPPAPKPAELGTFQIVFIVPNDEFVEEE